MSTPPAKPFWHSRMLWFNVLVAALAAAEAALGLLQPLLGEYRYALLAFTLALGNAVLRVLTTRALTLREPQPSSWDGERP